MGLIRVEIREDESLTSFCSRLAVANARSAYELCQDFDFSFRKVIDGDDDAITALSRISGVDRDILDAAAVKRAGEYSVFVGGDPTPWAFHPRASLDSARHASPRMRSASIFGREHESTYERRGIPASSAPARFTPSPS